MIKAIIDKVHWADQVKRLSIAMGETIDVTLKGQAKLFVRDAIRFTPPFGDAPIKEPFKLQREIGQDAVQRDARRVFVEASAIRKLCEGRFGEEITRLVATGKSAQANELLTNQGVSKLRTSGIQYGALGMTWEKARNKRGTVRTFAPYILHDGVLPKFNPRLNDFRAMPDDPELRRIVQSKMNAVGTAKSGWANAAVALKLPIPGWIKRSKKRGAGVYRETGKGLKLEIEISNNVPFIQASGRELRIVQRAWNNRQRNIDKQIKAAFRAAAKKQKI
jgi:hypothetical protein